MARRPATAVIAVVSAAVSDAEVTVIVTLAWVAPANVTSVSAVVIGGGAGARAEGGGGGGGAITGTAGGTGGSGIVVIRYPDTYLAAASTTGSPTITVAGGYRVYSWTGSGSITF